MPLMLTLAGFPIFVAKIAGLMSPSFHLVGLVAFLAGGLLYILDIDPLFPSRDADDHGAAEADHGKAKHEPVRPALSPIAEAASDRVDAALARMRSIPSNSYPPQARLEYEAIRDAHLPDLRAAHIRTRTAWPAFSPQAAVIDAELAVSFDLIATTLDELIQSASDEARYAFDVERRFLELRYPPPSTPVALAGAPILEAETS